MTHRYLIDEPADLAPIFAAHAEQCRATADVASAKALAAQWTIRAETFEACAEIARRAVLTASAQVARIEAVPLFLAGTDNVEGPDHG